MKLTVFSCQFQIYFAYVCFLNLKKALLFLDSPLHPENIGKFAHLNVILDVLVKQCPLPPALRRTFRILSDRTWINLQQVGKGSKSNTCSLCSFTLASTGFVESTGIICQYVGTAEHCKGRIVCVSGQNVPQSTNVVYRTCLQHN